MKELIISSLEDVTKKMINALEVWLENKKYSRCPFREMDYNCEDHCYVMFENLGTDICPCYLYGQEETILAFEIIIDVFKEYYGDKKKQKENHAKMDKEKPC